MNSYRGSSGGRRPLSVRLRLCGRLQLSDLALLHALGPGELGGVALHEGTESSGIRHDIEGRGDSRFAFISRAIDGRSRGLGERV